MEDNRIGNLKKALRKSIKSLAKGKLSNKKLLKKAKKVTITLPKDRGEVKPTISKIIQQERSLFFT